MDYLKYAGFILTTGLSFILSVLLFTSIADSRFNWWLLMGIALALEVGKLFKISHNYSLVSVLLIAVSVMGSAGGLNRAVTLADHGVMDSRLEREILQVQINQAMTSIDQNNASIDFYRDRDEIKGMVFPLQTENQKLGRELDGLRAQLSSKPPATVPELTAVLELLATVLALPIEYVRAAVVLLLAGLLDVLTVSFIRSGVLEELDDWLYAQHRDGGFEPDPEDKRPLPEKEDKPEVSKAPEAVSVASADNVLAMGNSYPSFRRMMLSRRDQGDGVLPQRACIRDLGMKDRQVRGFFRRLQDERLIVKGRRGQFEFAIESQKSMQLV